MISILERLHLHKGGIGSEFIYVHGEEMNLRQRVQREGCSRWNDLVIRDRQNATAGESACMGTDLGFTFWK